MRPDKQLVYRFKDKVYAFAYYYLGDRQDAEEVAQDVLLKLWHHCETLTDERITPWVMRVTRNVSIDYLRKRETRRGHELVDSEAIAFQLAESDEKPDEDRLDDEHFLEEVLVAMRLLKEPQRSIIQLREIHGMSYEEIGAAVNLPLSTVKVYLHRARRTLRDSLSERIRHGLNV